MSPDDDTSVPTPPQDPPTRGSGHPTGPGPSAVPSPPAAGLAEAGARPPRGSGPEPWRLPHRTGAYLTGTAGPRRLVGLDAARGLAMLGMMAAHVGYTTCGFTTLAGALHVAHGRSAILFAVIAGFSLGIISGRERPHDGERMVRTRLRILTRSALLLVVAAVLQTFQTPVAIIIGFYAAWLALAIPFLRWRPRSLFLAAGASAVLGPLVVLYLSPVLATVGLSLGWPGGGSANGALLEFFFTGAYPGATWMVFILLGLGLSRLDWSRWQQPARLAAVGAACAVIGYGGAWALSTAVAPEARPSYVWVTPDDASQCPSADVPGEGAWPTSSTSSTSSSSVPTSSGTSSGSGAVPGGSSGTSSDGGTEQYGSSDGLWESGPRWSPEKQFWASPTTLLNVEPHSGTPFEVVGGAGVAMVAIGLCLLLARAAGGRGRWLLAPLAAVGSMSLTVYSVHVAAIWVLGYSAVMATGNTVLGWMALVSVAGAMAWFAVFSRGPLEHLVHVVSVRATQARAS